MMKVLYNLGVNKLINSSDELIVILTIVSTNIFGRSYIFLWSKKAGLPSTPSGFGILLPFLLLIVLSVLCKHWTDSLGSILIILIAGLIYWFDDFKGLNPLVRVFVSFASGVLLFWFVVPLMFFTSLELLSLSITFGLFAVFLTNTINFYDGSDLNLATLIFLSGIILIVFSETSNVELRNIGFVMVGFSLGFGLINRVPLSLYLGDSGAFALALLFVLFLIDYVLGLGDIPAELMIVLALPIFDVFYVLLIRLYFGHNLLSRNYLHLYQRINIRFGGFFHLFPQFACVGTIFLMAEWIETNINSRFWALFFASVTATPIFYLACRGILVESKYFFGDGKSNR